MSHEHRFQRLRDDALFCECGEIRHVPVPPAVTWPSIPGTSPAIYPAWPWDPYGPNIPWVPTIYPTITYEPNTTVTTNFPNAGRMIVYGRA